MSDIDEILEAVRRYALSRWGQVPVYLKITLPDGREQKEVMPARRAPPERGPAGGADARQGEPWHSEDFSRVRWPGMAEMLFGEKQAAVVAALWDARGDEDPERDQADLLEIAQSECTRLSDLFRGHEAWGTLVVRGAKRGSYRLACEGEMS